MESDINLPALRQAGDLAEQAEGDFPGAQVLELIDYLGTDINNEISNLRIETEESLSDGDASQRLHTLNALRLNKRKLEQKIAKEIKEIQQIITGLKLRQDKSVTDILTNRMKEVIQDLSIQLRQLVDDFGI